MYQISTPVTRNIFHGVPTGDTNGEAMAAFVFSKPDTAKKAKVFDHILALLTRDGWQPIETAPESVAILAAKE